MTCLTIHFHCFFGVLVVYSKHPIRHDVMFFIALKKASLLVIVHSCSRSLAQVCSNLFTFAKVAQVSFGDRVFVLLFLGSISEVAQVSNWLYSEEKP